MKLRNGFTLAEVLITLGIIGVVAAMTIPTLVSNYKKQQYATALKKAYTGATQALILMTNDYGCGTDLVCTGLFKTEMSAQDFGEVFVKYFKASKVCETEAGKKCFSSSAAINFDSGENVINIDNATDGYKFITTDGFSFFVQDFHSDCTSYYDIANNCGSIYIDVNGLNGPNHFGRDIFTFWILNKNGVSLYPQGGAKTDYPWNAGANRCGDGYNYGPTCAGRIIEKGWVMDY